ncbi:dipeptidase [Candidatus Sumerlaeota bacterium]|nr:dipeptidase [Candidatus Sumerlaeota bacterium]
MAIRWALATAVAIIAVAMSAAPIPVMDLHSDTLLRVIDNGVDLADEGPWPNATLPHMREGHVTEQVYAVWTDSRSLHGIASTGRAMRMIGAFEAQAERHRDQMALARSMAEAREIVDSGRIAIILWLEGGAPIDENLDILREFHRLGIRGMTLTWMNNLPWAGSSTDPRNPEMGLTDFGRDVVREMNRIGMVVDLSHVSDQTFYDALEVTTDPVVLSHSCCKALSDHPRNVTDDMLRALAENGGVIGLNIFPGYLSLTWEPAWDATADSLRAEIDALAEEHRRGTGAYREARRRLIQENMPEEAVVTLDLYLDHIDHAIEVAGPEHVALGSDYDGIGAYPVGLESPANWQIVAEAMRERGHSEEVIRGVMGDNARRVFEQVIDH